MLTWEDVIKVGTSYQKLINGGGDEKEETNVAKKAEKMTDEEFYNNYPEMTAENLLKIKNNLINRIK